MVSFSLLFKLSDSVNAYYTTCNLFQILVKEWGKTVSLKQRHKTLSNKMIYREATIKDSEQIAHLHARSWQQHYRGILREEYLNQDVKQERLNVWQQRLEHPTKNQYVLVAEDHSILCGLACVYAGHDPVWGSLLDNLHVLYGYKGQGIGSKLLRSVAAWAYQQNPLIPFYLWVYTKNESARIFYDRMGGIHEETTQVENPGGGYGEVLRYVWRDIPNLISRE